MMFIEIAPTLSNYQSVVFKSFLLLSFVFGLVQCAPRLVGEGLDAKVAAEKHIAAAKAYIDAGDNRRGLMHLKKAEGFEKKSVDLFHTYALLYRAEGDVDRQKLFYKKALREDRSNAQIKNNYGSFLCFHNEAKKGLKLLKSSTRDYNYEGRAESFVNRGVCELTIEDLVQAEKSFQQALRLNAKSTRPYIELADIYLKRDDIHLADLYYQQFVSKSSQQSARSLWLGIKIARKQNDQNLVSSLGLFLQKRFPKSEEYKEFFKTQ